MLYVFAFCLVKSLNVSVVKGIDDQVNSPSPEADTLHLPRNSKGDPFRHCHERHQRRWNIVISDRTSYKCQLECDEGQAVGLKSLVFVVSQRIDPVGVHAF